MNHRRPNPDELRPEDLFRPEPSSAHAAPDQEAATQYLPPYPPADPSVPSAGGDLGGDLGGTRQLPPMPGEPQREPFFGFGQQERQQPQQYPGYQQPRQPAPGYDPQQAAPAREAPPAYGAGPGGYGGQQSFGPPHAQPAGYRQDAGTAPGGGVRRLSNRAIAVAVVAGCAVVGIIAGAVLSGGGSSAGAATSPSTAASATSTGGAGDAKSQASALAALFGTAADSRSEAIRAVADISACRDIDSAVSALKDSAGKHAALVSRLSGLAVDKLSGGQQLAEALRQGWEQSRNADEHYAEWGAASRALCGKKHHPLKKSPALTTADQASYQATADKQRAAQLWNTVASAYGLPQRSSTQL